jgi:peptidoglycan hydrolase CwlO-like protein
MKDEMKGLADKVINYIVLGIIVILMTVLIASIDRSDRLVSEQKAVDMGQNTKIEQNNLEAVKCITEIKTTLQNNEKNLQDIKQSVTRMEDKIDKLSQRNIANTNKSIEDFLAGNGYDKR